MPDDEFISNSKQEDLVFPVVHHTLSVQDLFVVGLDVDAALQPSAMAQLQNEDILQSSRRSKTASFRWCPVCEEVGRKTKLKLFQINFEDALYLCTEEQCHYPFSSPDLQTCVVSRSPSQMKSNQKVKRENTLNRVEARKSSVREAADTKLDDDFGFLWETEGTDSFASLRNEQAEFQDTSAVGGSTSWKGDADLLDNAWTSALESNSLSGAVSRSCQFLDLDSHKFVEDKSWAHANDSLDLVSISNDLDSVFFNATENASKTYEVNAADSKSNSDAFQSMADTTSTPEIADLFGSACAQINDPCEYECDDFQMPYEKTLPSGAEADVELGSFPEKEESKVSTCLDNAETDLPEPIAVKNKPVMQWQNENSLCWLDTLLHCIVNSVCLRGFLNWKVEKHMRSENLFFRLCATYDYVQERVNAGDGSNEMSNESLLLRDVRKDIFDILLTRFSLKQGVDQSVHEMFSKFLSLNPQIESLFSVQIRWESECCKCESKSVRRTTTDIISFSSAMSAFHPQHATFALPCSSCSAPNQSMYMIMEVVPPCLMMHFQHGLPHNRFKAMDFAIQDYLYSVTAVIQFVTNPSNHFVVWIRNCKKNLWMCCDDLKPPTCTWKRGAPKIPPKQIHMIMWEKQRRALVGCEQDWPEHLVRLNNEDAISSGDEFPQEVLTGGDADGALESERNQLQLVSHVPEQGNDRSLVLYRSGSNEEKMELDAVGGGSGLRRLQNVDVSLDAGSGIDVGGSTDPVIAHYIYLRHAPVPVKDGTLRMKVTNASINLALSSTPQEGAVDFDQAQTSSLSDDFDAAAESANDTQRKCKVDEEQPTVKSRKRRKSTTKSNCVDEIGNVAASEESAKEMVVPQKKTRKRRQKNEGDDTSGGKCKVDEKQPTVKSRKRRKLTTKSNSVDAIQNVAASEESAKEMIISQKKTRKRRQKNDKDDGTSGDPNESTLQAQGKNDCETKPMAKPVRRRGRPRKVKTDDDVAKKTDEKQRTVKSRKRRKSTTNSNCVDEIGRVGSSEESAVSQRKTRRTSQEVRKGDGASSDPSPNTLQSQEKSESETKLIAKPARQRRKPAKLIADDNGAEKPQRENIAVERTSSVNFTAAKAVVEAGKYRKKKGASRKKAALSDKTSELLESSDKSTKAMLSPPRTCNSDEQLKDALSTVQESTFNRENTDPNIGESISFGLYGKDDSKLCDNGIGNVDLEMLAQACEDLKSSHSTDANDHMAALEPKSASRSPVRLDSVNSGALVPINLAAVVPTARRNRSSASQQRVSKNAVQSRNRTAVKSILNDLEPRSKLASYGRATLQRNDRRPVCKLTGYRKDHLRRIRSESMRHGSVDADLRRSSIDNGYSNASSERSSELSNLSDLLPDIDVYSNCSELSDVINDLELYVNS